MSAAMLALNTIEVIYDDVMGSGRMALDAGHIVDDGARRLIDERTWDGS